MQQSDMLKTPPGPAPELSETDSDALAPDQTTGEAASDGQARWEAALEAIRGQLQRTQYETWFRRTAFAAQDGDTVRIAVNNDFSRDWLQRYYREVLEAAIAHSFGERARVEIIVDPECAAAAHPEPEEEEEETVSRGLGHGSFSSGSAPADGIAQSAPPLSSRSGAQRPRLLAESDVYLNPKYRFDSFVVGPCNRFAHAASVGASESPGSTYNPLFLHGNVGFGKTHLLQSFCHSVLEREPQSRILYLSCETFVNHFIGALENGDIQGFRNKYRNVDVLVVDDIHLLANKERTQEEFFHTFNSLYNAGRQIVLSSDSPPIEIPTLQERLVSRFKWGMVTAIERPCYETRVAVLKRKSRDRGQELTDEVAGLLAEHIDTNIRELEGAVTKLLGYASLTGQRVSEDLARQCLQDVFAVRRRQPSMEDVLRVVTDHFGVRRSDLQSRKKTNAIAYPRQIGMALARRITHLSLEDIGGFFGGRDHSTVLYGARKVEGLARTDPSVHETLEHLTLLAHGGRSAGHAR